MIGNLVPGYCGGCYFGLLRREKDGWTCPECGWFMPESPTKREVLHVSRWLKLSELPAYLEYLEGC
jgi:hypothetical protein